LELGGPEDFRKFERIWHPEYERYSDRIFNRLLALPLRIYELRESKEYLKQPFGNRVFCLVNKFTELKAIAEQCDVQIRNAIAHGSVTYGMLDISYKGENRNKVNTPIVLDPSEFGEKLDSLVDAANGLAAAILVFLARQEAAGRAVERERLPASFFLGALAITTLSTDWKMTNLVESTLGGGLRQVNVYCKTKSRLRVYNFLQATSTAVECTRFLGARYDRIALTIDCGEKASSMAIFRSADILRGIEQQWDLPRIARTSTEHNNLWFDDGLLAKWALVVKIAKTQFIAERPEVTPLAEIRDKGDGTVYALALKKGRLTRVDVRDIMQYIVRRKRITAFDTAIKLDTKTGRNRRRLLDHIGVRLHQEDARVRALRCCGWDDPGLVAIARWSRKGWAPSGALVRNKEIVGKILIEYNPTGALTELR
jgi:hypothetical protein